MSNGARHKKRVNKPVPIGAREVIESGGNVFADLNVPNAQESLAQAELARQIGQLIADRKLTQVKAAALLGIDQPKVSALLRGRLKGFSSDRLFRFLNALGSDVEIVVRPTNRKSAKAHTRVVVTS
jgi:predicted XRE-type DNA-binding protein